MSNIKQLKIKKTNVEETNNDNKSKPQWGLIAAIAAAVAASVCCVGPLVLVALGISGAWISNLTAFEPYRPIFITLTFMFLGLAYYKVYRKPKTQNCKPESYCANPKKDKINKAVLWSITLLIVGMFIFPNVIGALGSKPQTTTQTTQTNRITLEVKGMTCAACPVTVTKSLEKLDGVREANATFDPPEATVIYDPNKVSIKQLVEATTNAGFPSAIKGEI